MVTTIKSTDFKHVTIFFLPMFYKREIIFIAFSNFILAVVFSDCLSPMGIFYVLPLVSFKITGDLKFKIHKNVHVAIPFILEKNKPYYISVSLKFFHFPVQTVVQV